MPICSRALRLAADPSPGPDTGIAEVERRGDAEDAEDAEAPQQFVIS